MREQNYDIRRVTYLPQTEIETFPELRVGCLEQFFRDSFFKKRKEFDHEKEIRIIIENQEEPNDLLSIKIDVNFFDEFVLDPRLQTGVEGIRQQLNELGVNTTKIRQSDLYHFNTKTIQTID